MNSDPGVKTPRLLVFGADDATNIKPCTQGNCLGDYQELRISIHLRWKWHYPWKSVFIRDIRVTIFVYHFILLTASRRITTPHSIVMKF